MRFEYKLVTESPNPKQGENNWSATLTRKSDDLSITGYGASQAEAIKDCTYHAFECRMCCVYHVFECRV